MIPPRDLVRFLRDFTTEAIEAALVEIRRERADEDERQAPARDRVRRAAQRAGEALERSRNP